MSCANVDFKTINDNHVPDINPEGPMMDYDTGQIFLTIISVACEALIACINQLNIIGQESGDENYGTSLAHGANAIKNAIQESKIMGRSPFVAFTQISYIIKRTVDGFQGRIYSLFFDAGAKAFLGYQSNDQITIHMWLNALTAANKAISEFGKLSVGDRTLLDALISAQLKLADSLHNELDPIEAFGATVKAAEDSAMKTIHMQALNTKRLGKCIEFKYPDAGAHAVGIWMRGAYEATKLRLSSQSKKQ